MEHLEPLTWEAEEYENTEKTPDWFWALGIVAVALAVTALIFNNILFAILIILGAITAAMYAKREPAVLLFTLNERGVMIGHKLYPYNTLRAFGIDDTFTHRPRIIFRSQRALHPYIVIPLHEEDITLIRDYLLEFLPEEELEDPLLHKLLERWGL